MGINQQADAALTIDFGHEVRIDQCALTLRADFPHDSYWQQVTLAFSDGVKKSCRRSKAASLNGFLPAANGHLGEIARADPK